MRVRQLATALTVALFGVLLTAVAVSAQTYTLPSTGSGGSGVGDQLPTIALVALALVAAAALIGGVARRARAN